MKVIDRRTKRKKSLNENSYRMLYYWAIEHLIDILLSRISQNIGHHHYTTLTSSSGSSNAQALLAQVVMLREKSRNCFDSSCEEAPLARWSLTRLTDKITR